MFILPENWIGNSCLFWVLNDKKFVCSYDLVYLSGMYRYMVGYKGEGELITNYTNRKPPEMLPNPYKILANNLLFWVYVN